MYRWGGLPIQPSGKTLQGLGKRELLSQAPRSSNGEVSMTRHSGCVGSEDGPCHSCMEGVSPHRITQMQIHSKTKTYPWSLATGLPGWPTRTLVITLWLLAQLNVFLESVVWSRHTNRIQPAYVSTLDPMDLNNAFEFIANVKSHIAANVQLAYTAHTVPFQSAEGLASDHCCWH